MATTNATNKGQGLTDHDKKVLDLHLDKDNNRITLLGHSETAMLRLMGSMGFKPKQAIRAFHLAGIDEFAETTVRAQISQWKQRGKVPEVTGEQKKVLEKLFELSKAA